MTSWFGTLTGVLGVQNLMRSRHSIPKVMRGLTRTIFSPSKENAKVITSSQIQRFPEVVYSHSDDRIMYRRRFSSSGGWVPWMLRGGDADSIDQISGSAKDNANALRNDSLSGFSITPTELSSSTVSYFTSTYSVQGSRSYMEDEFFVSHGGDFAAVFDGHGGSKVSHYLRQNLYANVQAVLPGIVPKKVSNASPSAFEADDSIETASTLENASTKNSADLFNAGSSVSIPTCKNYQDALESALDKIDREVQQISHWSYQGSTAAVVWIHEERQRRVISDQNNKNNSVALNNENAEASAATRRKRSIIATNIGDSRAVLCRNNTAWELTRDHKPDDPAEQSRIEALGGDVVWCGGTDMFGQPIPGRGVYRVNGSLALSRAVGDRADRPYVTAEPETIVVPLQEGADEFIIIATDGLWDVFESNEAIAFVQNLILSDFPKKLISQRIVKESLLRGSYDNVTVVIIFLDGEMESKSET